MKPTTISIPGREQTVNTALETADESVSLRKSFLIVGATRSTVERNRVTLDDTDMLQFVFDDETSWFCTPDTIEELFPEQTTQSRSGDALFEIPLTLKDETSERGLVSDAVLKIVNVFSRKTVHAKVRDLAADLERKQLENLSGLYRVNGNFELEKFTADHTSSPYLLFIHGTSSSTKGSFGGLQQQADVWNALQQKYGTHILALQHETLTKRVLDNVLTLAEALPVNCRLHLVTHSRGGLVGDVLSRFCNANEKARGFDEAELGYLKKEQRAGDLETIDKIVKALEGKRITVEKFIRVACPAAGTTLASNRLDHFFNIVFNLVGVGVGIAASPVYGAFKNFMGAVVDAKNNVEALPGLEAMNPESPFIKALNSPATQVALDAPLTVISGKCHIRFNKKALFVIAGKLFFQRDNDLVVNTRSMYQGTKRTELVQYLVDEESGVDHFNYFSNKRTSLAIVEALKAPDGELIPGFRKIQQETLIESQRQAAIGLEGGQVFTNTVTGTRPIVVLIPGIMGSNLTVNGEVVWINYWTFIKGGLTNLAINTNGVGASSLIKTSYKKLVQFLSETYDVVTFPFDWRLQLNDTARNLKNEIERLLEYKQPVKIIGHSMGGVLVRDFIVSYPDTWKRLNESKDFRMLFLGSPLGGSFRIPAVLFGQDAIINKLAKIDIFHTKKELISMFSQMPGILSLLPLTTDAENDFANEETWKRLRFADPSWPVPTKARCTEFENYRNKILERMGNIDFGNMVYVAGRDKATPCGYKIEDTPSGKELVFLSTAEGDQSVTWDSGIPQQMNKAGSVYYTNVSHGALANDAALFKGIADILAFGFTNSNVFSKKRPSVRSEQKLFRTPQQFDFDVTPRGIEATLLGLQDEQPATTAGDQSIQVTICHGDLRYASYPLMAGHFYKDGILNAEKSIDRYLKGALSERHRLGIYPGEIGSSEAVIGNEEFKGAIIIGLGKQGELSAYQLTISVEQAVAKYLLNINQQTPLRGTARQPESVGLSSLIVGCGYGGLPVETSVRAILQGVQNANQKIRSLHETASLVQSIEFIELFDDTALSCLYALHEIENEEHKSLFITTGNKKIKTIFGSRKRLPLNKGGNWWNRINVQVLKKPEVEDGVQCLLFSASTGGAREEQRELYSTTAIIEHLIEDISKNDNWSTDLARTVFELLVPNDFKEQLQRQGHIIWGLDKTTAAYPWELLQDGSKDRLPFSVNGGMVRQLATQDYRLRINAVTKDNALIVGDPKLSGFINQLPGAKEEAELVAGLLSANGFETNPVINGEAHQIIRELLRDDYKIIHLAGHGIFEEKILKNGKERIRSGMVIGKDIYLSTREIKQMSTVPELVFVNCCYLGQVQSKSEELFRSRYKMAANIGTQLIENGVKAVVVAGWAVDDKAALEFARTFYNCMFDGASFGEAVLEARQAVHRKHSRTNTWGAYQCYGDPFYKFRENFSTKLKTEWHFVTIEEALIELGNLANQFETENYTEEELMQQLTSIETAIEKAGLKSAKLLEKIAFMYAELADYDAAVDRFQRLLSMEDANFSVAALEKFCNVRSKKCVEDSKKPKGEKAAIKEIGKVIRDLKQLIGLGETAERRNLLGSTYKRLAYMQQNKEDKIESLKEAAANYYEGHKAASHRSSVYGLSNFLELQAIINLVEKSKWNGEVYFNNNIYPYASPEDVLQILEKLLLAIDQNGEEMNFWELTNEANIRLCMVVVDPKRAEQDDKAWDQVLNVYRRVWVKAGSKAKKVSEVEYLDMLADFLTMAPSQNLKWLKSGINKLKDELTKMV